MLVGELFMYLGEATQPVLSDVVLAGASALEQCQWELSNHAQPRSFAHSTTRPVPVHLPVQGDARTRNRCGTDGQRFAGPLLRQVDDLIAGLPTGSCTRSISQSVS
ncbi:hypothetical protein STCU_12256 [Strigomonas culicis]|uniref:Uncharacterized protein n=1 Tax=Strigomonas culicis TaxID=28005 RepID=S9UKM4_9TRYP|nr:hypothetical protein STCU_12256 [Strigomonas culicis]|eukprot:EPY15201.1 hypothetical protein STCU_12256 [Strigomonas culicis]